MVDISDYNLNPPQSIGLEVATLKAEMKAEMRNLVAAIDSVNRQLEAVVQVRTDIALINAQRDQWELEKKTMWSRVDSVRETLDVVQKKQHRLEGAVQLAHVVFGTIAGALIAVIIGGATSIISMHSDLRVQQQQIQTLERK